MNVTIPVGSTVSPYDVFKTDNIDWKKIYIIGFEIYDENNDSMRTVMVDPHEFFTDHTIFDMRIFKSKDDPIYFYRKKYILNTSIGKLAFPLMLIVYEDHSMKSDIGYYLNKNEYPISEEEIKRKIKSIWISY